jgi:hypothetical protein
VNSVARERNYSTLCEQRSIGHVRKCPIEYLRPVAECLNGMSCMYEIEMIRRMKPFAFSIINHEFKVRWYPDGLDWAEVNSEYVCGGV